VLYLNYYVCLIGVTYNVGTLYNYSFPSPSRNVCRCLVLNSETVNLKYNCWNGRHKCKQWRRMCTFIPRFRFECMILLLQQFPAGVFDHCMYWQTQLIWFVTE
jgi:hypothetical protein